MNSRLTEQHPEAPSTPIDAHPTRSVDLPDGTSVHLADTGGDLPVAVFVHGIFLNHNLWRHVIEAMKHTHRCVAVDLVGHGRTIGGPTARFTLTDAAQTIADVVDVLELDRFHLVGNNSGGGICQIYAAHHADRLRSLTLINCDTHDNWPPPAFDIAGDLARSGTLDVMVDAMLGDIDLARSDDALGSGYQFPERLTTEAVESYIAPFKDPARVAAVIEWLGNGDNVETTSVEPQLSKLEVPTHILWGDADVFFPVEWAHWLHRTIPGAHEPVIIPGGKLFSPDDNPAPLIELLHGAWGN